MKSQNFFLQIHVIINLSLFVSKLSKSKVLLHNTVTMSQCDSVVYAHTLHNGIVTTPVCLSPFNIMFSF